MNLITNGDFETGDMTGWDYHFGTVTAFADFFGKWKRKIDYNSNSPGQPQPMIVNATSMIPGQLAPIAPYSNSKMLLINDLVGGNHITCIHQDVTIPEDFSNDCGYISFSWGAMLQGSNHTEIDRPKFSFDINRKDGSNWKNFMNAEYLAPPSGGDGWSDISSVGSTDPVWYKAGNEKYSLGGLLAGDVIRVRFVAEDCTAGKHGGAAYIDNVVISTGCDAGGASTAPITYDALPNVFTPNGDGVNDIWTVNNLANACSIEFIVYDRWGDQIYFFTTNTFDGTWPNQVNVWNGKVRSKRRKIGSGLRKKYVVRKIRNNDMNNGVVYFIIKFANCNESIEIPGFIHIFI